MDHLKKFKLNEAKLMRTNNSEPIIAVLTEIRLSTSPFVCSILQCDLVLYCLLCYECVHTVHRFLRHGAL